MCIYVHGCVCVCLSVQNERERERERESNKKWLRISFLLQLTLDVTRSKFDDLNATTKTLSSVLVPAFSSFLVSVLKSFCLFVVLNLALCVV